MSAPEDINRAPESLTDDALPAELARLDRARGRTAAFLRHMELEGEPDKLKATVRLSAVLAGRYEAVFLEVRRRMRGRRDLTEAVGLYLMGFDEEA